MSFISNLIENQRLRKFNDKVEHTEVNIETYPELDALIAENNMTSEDVIYNAKRATAFRNVYGLSSLVSIDEQIGAVANKDYVLDTRSTVNLYDDVAKVMSHSPSVVTRMTVKMNDEYSTSVLVDDVSPLLNIKPYTDDIVNNSYEDKIGEFLVQNMTVSEMIGTLDVVHAFDAEKSDKIRNDILHSSAMDSISLDEFISYLDVDAKKELVSDLGGSYSDIDDNLLGDIVAFNNMPSSRFDIVDFQNIIPLAATQNIDAYNLHNPKELAKNTSAKNMKMILDKYPIDSSTGQRVKTFLDSKPDEYYVREVVDSCITSDNNELKLVAIESYLYDETQIDRPLLVSALQTLDNAWDSSNTVSKAEELVSIHRESFNSPINWGVNGHDIDVVTKVYVDKLDELIDWRSDVLESKEDVELDFDGISIEKEVSL